MQHWERYMRLKGSNYRRCVCSFTMTNRRRSESYVMRMTKNQWIRSLLTFRFKETQMLLSKVTKPL